MHILVVDDEETHGKLVALALKRLGHLPTLACHPRDALERFREEEFDAVITDVDMPEMDGVELACTIRRERGEIPIAFCTGSALSDETRERAAQIGVLGAKVWRADDVKELLAELQLVGKAKA